MRKKVVVIAALLASTTIYGMEANTTDHGAENVQNTSSAIKKQQEPKTKDTVSVPVEKHLNRRPDEDGKTHVRVSGTTSAQSVEESTDEAMKDSIIEKLFSNKWTFLTLAGSVNIAIFAVAVFNLFKK